MTEQVLSRIERWGGRIMTFCAVGTCVCLAWLAYQQVLLAGQASAGQKARTTQQLRQPVAAKVYADAFRRGVITARDLACFRDSAKCPPVKP